VSAEVACAMAEGAIAHSAADLSAAVTGLAGPTGGSPGKPVGLVHIAASRRGGATLQRAFRFGDIGRAEVRQRAVEEVFKLILEAAGA
jgi:nicotinamide-nucleotide amidase